MGKSIWLLFLAAAPMFVGAGSVMAADAAPSHCGADEKTYFSCSTGKKLISVCGSRNLTAKTGYLQYRFGVAGKPELILPSGKESPVKHFTFSNSLGTSAGSAVLTVGLGKFRYEVYSNYVIRGPEDDSQGVRVNRDGKEVADVRCKATSVNDLSNLENLGLPEE